MWMKVGPDTSVGANLAVQLPAGSRRVAREAGAATHWAGLGDELSPGLRSRRRFVAKDVLIILA